MNCPVFGHICPQLLYLLVNPTRIRSTRLRVLRVQYQYLCVELLLYVRKTPNLDQNLGTIQGRSTHPRAWGSTSKPVRNIAALRNSAFPICAVSPTPKEFPRLFHACSSLGFNVKACTKHCCSVQGSWVPISMPERNIAALCKIDFQSVL